jgi:uncharacterized protein YidB (DUF937 family)
MGLMDVLNGMQHGPRGDRSAAPSSGSGGGMSPMTMAILGLLAYKALKHFTGQQQTAAPGSGAPAPAPSGGLGGGLAGGLGGALGGLLGAGAGGAAGSVLSGGLGDLMKQLQQGGLGDAASTWVSSGANKQVSASDLSKALGADQINMLASQTGMSSDELLQNLAKSLPDVINHLTPDGRLPTEQEASRMI